MMDEGPTTKIESTHMFGLTAVVVMLFIQL